MCGDGRCDSPGHCAKYGTYTIMDESSSKIIYFSVVQVTEVTSSNAMEAEGCNWVLYNLKDEGIKVKCLTTDRHVTITSEMKKHPEITHQYDIWHLAKWVVKKLTKKERVWKINVTVCIISFLMEHINMWRGLWDAHREMDIHSQPCW